MNAEHTDVDEYTCPEPGCEFMIGAAGPVDDDGYDPFAEEVREHQARHFAERVEALSVPGGPSERVIRGVLAGLIALSGAVVGIGVQAIVTPDPKPIIRTIVRDVPPACLDAIDAARDERAHGETEQQHTALAAERATELSDAALSLDPEVIEDAAKALDTEKRLVQQAGLDLADATARFDEAAGNCAPEVTR